MIEPEPPVTGCTDHHATNYNPSAEVDDGSCTYPEPEPPVSGCTDTNATNYNESAEVEDGSCTFQKIEDSSSLPGFSSLMAVYAFLIIVVIRRNET